MSQALPCCVRHRGRQSRFAYLRHSWGHGRVIWVVWIGGETGVWRADSVSVVGSRILKARLLLHLDMGYGSNIGRGSSRTAQIFVPLSFFLWRFAIECAELNTYARQKMLQTTDAVIDCKKLGPLCKREDDPCAMLRPVFLPFHHGLAITLDNRSFSLRVLPTGSTCKRVWKQLGCAPYHQACQPCNRHSCPGGVTCFLLSAGPCSLMSRAEFLASALFSPLLHPSRKLRGAPRMSSHATAPSQQTSSSLL